MPNSHRWKLIAFLFAIPIVSGAIFEFEYARTQSDWMAEERRALPSAGAKELQKWSLGAICADATNRARVQQCVSQTRLGKLRTTAAITATITMLLLLWIWWAGQRSRRDRRALLNLFKPGTYVVLCLTVGFVIVHTVLFISALLYIPFLAQLILLGGIGALIAVFQIVRLLFAFQKDKALVVDGERLEDATAPELRRLIADVARSVGTEAPDNILAGINPTFFVTEMPVQSDHREYHGRSLYLSVPLCRVLTENELKSILGHELAHFHGQDTEFSRRFYPIYRRAQSTLEVVSRTAQSVGGGGWVLVPAVWLLSFYLESFSVAEAAISRQRELAADEIGARMSGAREFGVALMKVIRYEDVWEQVYKDLLNGEEDRTSTALPGELFQKLAEKHILEVDREKEVRKLETETLEHPTDSHPPLQERLTALGLSTAELYEASSTVRPARSAVVLLPRPESLERQLLPAFAPKHGEVQAVFNHRQPGFVAMEYYALILNRSFLIYAATDGLYGMKFMGLMMDTKQPRFFEGVEKLLDDPWFVPGSDGFEESMKESRRNFIIRYSEIADVTFDSTLKWGMGAIQHSGKLRLKLKNRRNREFVLLGNAYGDGIRRVIQERAQAAAG